MKCDKIPNTDKTAAVVISSSSYRDLPGGSEVVTNYITAGSNYEAISAKGCTCLDGFSWDSKRLRCYSSKINLI